MPNIFDATIGFLSPFKWQEVVHLGETRHFLVSPTPMGIREPERWPSTYRSVALHDQASLFKKFAKLSGFAQIEQFTNTYGPLGLNPKAWINEGEPGESLELWENAILEMRDAIDLWQAIAIDPPNELFLKKHVTPNPSTPNIRFRRSDRRVSEFGDSVHDPRALGLLEQSALCLAEMIENNLQPEKFTSGLAGGLTWNRTGRDKVKFSLRFKASTLFVVLWMQFARAVAENSSLTECQVCHNPMLIGARGSRGKRGDSVTCGDDCRSIKSRKNKAAVANGKAPPYPSKKYPVTHP
jgi:hypothetical protein